MNPFALLPAGLRENHPGMLTEAEGELLASLAAGKRVLELGSYTGLSTIVLARVATEVWSVDWHGGDAEIGARDTLAQLDRNLRRYGVRDRVVLLVGRFGAVLPQLAAGSFDLAYIDGAHDFESVEADTREALRLVAPGGTLVWHDAEREPVGRAASATGLEVTRGPDRLAWARVAAAGHFSLTPTCVAGGAVS